MATRDVSRDFDQLSSVYDETRHPLDSETIENLHRFFAEHGWNVVLEVGVGTGRVAGPLRERGVRIYGLDASRGMLRRAAGKGLPYLVRGTAYRLPFPDRTFDVGLFVHVLHILDRPEVALAEVARVGTGGALAVMDRPWREDSPARGPDDEPRQIVRQVLAEAGYPDMVRGGPRVREREILQKFPPHEVRLLSDRVVTEPLGRWLNVLEKRGYRHLLRVPPDVLARAVAQARERVGDRTVTFHRREAVAWWPDPPGPDPAPK